MPAHMSPISVAFIPHVPPFWLISLCLKNFFLDQVYWMCILLVFLHLIDYSLFQYSSRLFLLGMKFWLCRSVFSLSTSKIGHFPLFKKKKK